MIGVENFKQEDGRSTTVVLHKHVDDESIEMKSHDSYKNVPFQIQRVNIFLPHQEALHEVRSYRLLAPQNCSKQKDIVEQFLQLVFKNLQNSYIRPYYVLTPSIAFHTARSKISRSSFSISDLSYFSQKSVAMRCGEVRFFL